MRQLVRGLHTYSLEYDDKVLPTFAVCPAPDPPWWGNMLWEANAVPFLYTHLGTYQLYQCPSDFHGEYPGDFRTVYRLGPAAYPGAPPDHPDNHAAIASPLMGWSGPDVGYSYTVNSFGVYAQSIPGFNDTGSTDYNHMIPGSDPPGPDPSKSAFVRIGRLGRMIWSVDHVGAQFAWASALRGESHTDYYAASVGEHVEGEDYPFQQGPTYPGNRVSKRHAGKFNAAFYDGSVESFVWGDSERADWTGGK